MPENIYMCTLLLYHSPVWDKHRAYIVAHYDELHTCNMFTKFCDIRCLNKLTILKQWQASDDKFVPTQYIEIPENF